jgi:adenylate cyclase, class 2
MQPEIEAKFLDIDHGAMRATLQKAGAELVQPERLTIRKNFDMPDGGLERGKNAWVRVRNEGDKITLAYKQLDHRGLDGTKEVQVTVDSFERAVALMEAIGLEARTHQETKRESWKLDGCEVELDEWPWIKPFLEIEGPDEASVKAVAAKLGLDWSKALHGSVEIAYRAEYNVTDPEINHIPVITFTEPTPDWLQKQRRT